jgi:tetratricopeptide (TPR) repeat protein
VKAHHVEMILIIALFFDALAVYCGFETEEITNNIEENLLNSLDENLIGSKHLQKFSLETMVYLEGWLTSWREYQTGSYLKSEQTLTKTTAQYKSQTQILSDKYNKSISNSTLLKNNTINQSLERVKINKYKRGLELINVILLIIAIICLYGQKDIHEALQSEIEKQKKELQSFKEFAEKLDSLLIEDMKESWKNKGNTLNSQGKYEKAIQAYDKAIMIAPHDADTWYRKGLILKLLGQTEDADEAFEKAKELDLQPDPDIT